MRQKHRRQVASSPIFPVFFLFIIIFCCCTVPTTTSSDNKRVCQAANQDCNDAVADTNDANNEHCTAKYHLAAAIEPGVYPSLAMNRYRIFHDFYPLFRLLADCYFTLVNAAFALFNAFQPIRNAGRWQNASKLLFMPARKAAELIRQGNITSTALVKAYIERIQAANPLLNAVVYTNFNEALKRAADVDAQLERMTSAQRANLKTRKPLYGVPFTSKNNLKTKGFVITACNRAFTNANAMSTETAPIVQRMLDAGAILTAITSMPNLGESTYGDDSVCGVTNNPHDTRRTSGGSSSGEAALIAAAASPMGIGNDIGGSLRIPASYCGIFSLKPTTYPAHTVPYQGIVPNFAAYPPDKDMLTNGPMCRYVDDLSLGLSVMANKAPNDYDIHVDFANDFCLFYLDGLDIMLSESVHEEQRNAVRKVKNYFEQVHNATVQKVAFPLMNRIFELWALTGYSEGLKPFHPNITGEFIQLLHAEPGELNTTFWMWALDALKTFAHPKDEAEHAFVAGKLAKLRRQVSKLLGRNGVLVMPIVPAPVPFHHMEPFKTYNFVYALVFNVLGLPVVAIPTGKSPVTNMPLGVQIAGAPFNEALLIAVARELEKAFGGWVPPGRVPRKLLMATTTDGH